MKVAIITISDMISNGEKEDIVGQEIETVFLAMVPNIKVARSIIPNEEALILEELETYVGEKCDWIFTIGGTGPSPAEITPETTLSFVDCEVPGLAEYIRSESIKETKSALFHRGVAGLCGSTYIVNAPSALKEARFYATLLAPLMELGQTMVNWKEH